MFLQDAVPADLPALACLEQELFPENWMSESTLLAVLNNGPAFVMRDHTGVVLGYALTHWREGIMDLLRLGVSPSKQGQGIGHLLLRRVLRVPHRMCVLTVRFGNDRAIGLYYRHGFKLHGATDLSMVLLRTQSPPTHARTSGT